MTPEAIDATVRAVLGRSAAGRRLRVQRIGPLLGLPWETWHVYPERDDAEAAWAFREDDAWYAATERQVGAVAAQLVAAGLLAEVLHRGRTAWICVHDALPARLAHHRSIAP